MKRAIRRHHRARVMQARKSYWCGSDKSPRQLGMLSSTVTPCSGYCCGNPRKWFGSKSMQERRFECLLEEGI